MHKKEAGPTHYGMVFRCRKRGNVVFATTWLDLEEVIVSKVNQKGERHTKLFHSWEVNKENKLQEQYQ